MTVKLIQASICAFGASLVCGPMVGAADSADVFLSRADDHYFNLEYPEAIRDYYAAMGVGGPSASIWNRIATTLLYEELHRLGKLETSAFRDDNEFLDHEKPRPDPRVKNRFYGALGESRRLAEAELEGGPDRSRALFDLSNNYALDANYLFMVDKSYVSALRAGNRARKYSNQLRETAPDCVDAYLVAGAQEYVVGSLPWAVRVLVAFGGVRGSKEKGRAWVELVAREGQRLKSEARVLLALLYRRERRPEDAASVLKELIQQYPRNYVLRLELASMRIEAGEEIEALELLRETSRMVETNVQGYGRMPQRLKEALGRKIDALEEELESVAVVYRAVYPGRVRTAAPSRATRTSTWRYSPSNS